MYNVEIPKYPTNDIEYAYIKNSQIVAGMDEVGRGSWAGPLVMAAVIPGEGTIPGVRDSKKISQKKRELLVPIISHWAVGIAIGTVSNNEIDEFGMSQSLKLCAHRTIKNLEEIIGHIDVVLLDGNIDFLERGDIKTELIIKGDNFSHAIACSSIIAKVHRDRYMSSNEIAGKYKGYFFEKNKGYPAPIHKEALKKHGATPIHRISWDIFGENREDFKRWNENALF